MDIVPSQGLLEAVSVKLPLVNYPRTSMNWLTIAATQCIGIPVWLGHCTATVLIPAMVATAHSAQALHTVSKLVLVQFRRLGNADPDISEKKLKVT